MLAGNVNFMTTLLSIFSITKVYPSSVIDAIDYIDDYKYIIIVAFSNDAMSEKMKCLGSTKVSSKLRMSLLKDVAEKMDVTDGDVILFYEDERGQIVIKKG